jgi:hypothetical protein
MTLTRLVIIFLAALMSATPAAADAVPDVSSHLHVRIIDHRLRTLFEEGLHRSPTLRGLVSRLEASDVVVYLQPDAYAMGDVAGRLTWLSAVNGVRYVMVRVRRLASVLQQLAMIGHELQHAVEVAETPEIVDGPSMLREYTRIGYINGAMSSGVTVDTQAALDAGEQVAEELRSAP